MKARTNRVKSGPSISPERGRGRRADLRRSTSTMITLLFLVQLLSGIPLSAALLYGAVRLLAHLLRGRPLGSGAGRGVLVTGCDSGFGQQLARRLDARGFVVFAGCLCPEGAGARSLARHASANLRVLKLDVTSEADVEQAKRTVQKNLPHRGLWAVVNNAGVTDWAEIEWSSAEDFRAIAEVNLFGSIRVSMAFLPLVRASKGRMVYVSSIFAFFHCLNMGAYSVSKRGLEAFADCLRVEMASFGVKVSIIQPGNFAGATNIVRPKTALDIWTKLDAERRRIFNREYLEAAAGYFSSTCRQGFQHAEPVVAAMLHAITSGRPKRRYLLVSALDAFFFRLFPFLPAAVADAVFSLSSMYAKRGEMLYAKSSADEADCS
ncbi:D-beta-hydroxybutyrate dehydrogenase, mitochondrial [Menidia menidia]